MQTLLILAILGVSVWGFSADDDGENVVHHWVYQTSPQVPYVHMGMIAALPNNTLAVAFQESSIGEGCNDQSIFLTLSSDGGETWSPHTVAASADYACWGPVLHYDDDTSLLWLFYSVSSWQQNRTPTNCGSLGQSYPGGTIFSKQSADFGATWSTPVIVLPFDSRGNISKMSANLLFETQNGSWILPFWEEGRTVYDLVPDCSAVLISEDKGASWTPYGCISNNSTWLIENTIAQASNGSLFQVFRTTMGVLYISWSLDGGYTWLDAVPTAVPNPNSKICMFNRNDNNEVVLALNPSSSQRNPITLATSTDGFTWAQFAVLANNASVSESYPTPIQVGQQVFTVYSDSTNNGIMLAITDLP